MAKEKLLIIDDDEGLRTQLKWALGEDYEVYVAEDRAGASEVFQKERPALITLDLGLPPDPAGTEEGFRVLAEVLGVDNLAKVIVVTGRTEKNHALRAIEAGAYDYFCKPIELPELKVVLKRASHVHALEKENQSLQARVEDGGFEGMLGTSPQMQEVFDKIQKLATTDVPVLITGESGTGKELAAGALHRRSARRNGPFVVINCGAIPENLLESELFGHEKGAFTSAHTKRKGRIEMAQGGTLFLDEIGELSPPLQVKLLRFLQEHHIERVGGREAISVDVRIIAATNVDLSKAMEEKRFREDLYYRISVVVVSMPPLRERDGDIALLAQALLQRYVGKELGKSIVGFTDQALRALKSHRWPGNIRELENRIKRAVIMAEGAKIRPEDLELEAPSSRYVGLTLREAHEALDQDLIRRALTRNKGNFTQAAAELGISRPTFYELLEKLGISRDDM